MPHLLLFLLLLLFLICIFILISIYSAGNLLMIDNKYDLNKEKEEINIYHFLFGNKDKKKSN
tara:strand:+ start:163 stop:348 length:186 start_codon:yes stop_codon:yes gene_type:complete